MYILKNSFKNLLRNKQRNALLSFITLIIITAVVVAVIIQNSAIGVIKNFEESHGAEVMISIDFEKMLAANGEAAKAPEPIATSLYLEAANSDLLLSANYQGRVEANFKTLTPVGKDDEDDASKSFFSTGTLTESTLLVLGYTDANDLIDFKNGSRVIIEGEPFKEVGEVIISQELAKLNNLTVGDTFIVNSAIDKDQQSTFTVTGIYQDLTAEYPSGLKVPAMNNRNQIITNVETIIEMGPSVNINAKYILKSPELISEFETYLRSIGLSEDYIVTTDKGLYDEQVGPMLGLANFTTVFLITVLVLGGVIIILISILSIRERKYEIGVLRAIGMNKFKVATGFLCESLITIAVCLVIGLTLGTMISEPIANNLLKTQAETSNQNNNLQQSNGSSTSVVNITGPSDNGVAKNSNDANVTELDVSLSKTALLSIIGISFTIAIISSGVAIIYILRYEPIKILTNRN